MFKKTFVSLYFTPQGMQVLQLDSKKKVVKVAGSLKLPSGIVSDHKTVNSTLLAAYIKKYWDEQKIKEKFVGIVIPEISTLTKTMSLPKVDIDELGEAVSWQIQDFLPWSFKNTVLDWKIIAQDKKGYQVIVVSMNKEILGSYVDATVLAGLFPIVVETPSLSLSRFSPDNSSVGKLIFYSNFGQSIFVLVKGQKIFGSSVLSTDNQESLISTAGRIINHYKEVDVGEINVGGVGVQRGLIKKFEETFQKEVKLLSCPVSGLTKDQIQNYLIPIFFQLKDPAKPDDEGTVNLLPLKQVKKYENKRLRLQIWSLSLMVTYFIWVSFFASMATYLYVNQQINILRSYQITTSSKNKEGVDAVIQVQKINDLSKKILAINNATVFPQTIINAIYAAKPQSVFIDIYKIDTDKGSIYLEGVSTDRKSLLIFTQKLEENELFSLVQLPISSLEVEQNLDFHLTFNYLPLSSVQKGVN